MGAELGLRQPRPKEPHKSVPACLRVDPSTRHFRVGVDPSSPCSNKTWWFCEVGVVTTDRARDVFASSIESSVDDPRSPEILVTTVGPRRSRYRREEAQDMVQKAWESLTTPFEPPQWTSKSEFKLPSWVEPTVREIEPLSMSYLTDCPPLTRPSL